MFRALAEMVSFDFIGGPFGTVTPRFHLPRYLVSITAAVGHFPMAKCFHV